MHCDRVRELVSEALDQSLERELDARFHRHLAGCPLCRTFYTELKESLLLLDELPVVEVGEEFDRAVWGRIRGVEEPEGPWAAWRARLGDLVESWRMTNPVWKWSPVGVAALLAVFVALSSGPLPGTIGATAGRMAASDEPTATPTPSGGDRDWSAPTPPAASARVAKVDVGVEDPGDIPEAIERFLQMNEARDLSLEGDADRYRRSNYSYPLRRVPDPARYGGVGSIPVFGPQRPVAHRGPILPVSPPASDGTAVIAF